MSAASSQFLRMARAVLATVLALTGLAAIGLATAGSASALGPTIMYTLQSTPTAVQAGGQVSVKITAMEVTGASTTDASTVTITSNDPLATFPASVTLAAGTATFTATLRTAGAENFTATNSMMITGTSNDITVTAGPLSKLTIAPAATTATAGTATSVTVKGTDTYGNATSSYLGTVHLTSSDKTAALAADYTYTAADKGAHTFAVTYRTSGPQTVTATDTTTPTLTATTVPVTVAATTAAATHFLVTAPSGAVKGTAVPVTVSARDAGNNSTSNYTGTIKLTSSDTTATQGATLLPATYTFVAGDAGSHTFQIAFNTVGMQTVTATDQTTATITGTSDPINVGLTGTADHFVVTAPTTATTGTPVTVTVTAKDASNQTVTGYTGTVQLSSTDAMATLPTGYQFTAADMGTHVFGVTFKTTGSQSVTATDTTTPTVKGTSSPSTTVSGPVTKFLVTAPATASTGAAASVTITAKDANNTTVTGYVGTIHLTSTDAMATLPADYTFTTADAGVHTAMVIFKTAGSQTVTVTQTAPVATPQPTGTSNPVTVTATTLQTTTQVGSNPAALRALVKATPPSGSTTTPPTPTGMVSFTVNGAVAGTATLDANGIATLAYTLKTGNQTVVATYAGDTGFAGSSGSRAVTPPTIKTTLSSANPKSSYGWYRNNVKVSYSCTAGSGAVLSCPKLTTLSQQGAAVSVTKTVVDKDGGRTVVTTTVKIDKTKPTVQVTGVTSGQTYNSPPRITCKASDSLSGIASCTITRTHQGKHYTYTATATDKAGNKAVLKGNYDLKQNK